MQSVQLFIRNARRVVLFVIVHANKFRSFPPNLFSNLSFSSKNILDRAAFESILPYFDPRIYEIKFRKPAAKRILSLFLVVLAFPSGCQSSHNLLLRCKINELNSDSNFVTKTRLSFHGGEKATRPGWK